MKALMSLATVFVGLIAATGMAGENAVEKLVAAQDRALESFRTDEVLGQLYSAITAFSIEAKVSSTEGLVTVKYKEGGLLQVKNYVMPLEELPVATEGTSLAASWGVRELQVARAAALKSTRQELGSLYESIYGISATRNASGKSGSIRILYQESEEPKTKSYFCHVHGGEGIDCH